MHRTHCNIYWVRDSIPATQKILLHESQLKWWADEGREVPKTYEELPDGFRGKKNIDKYIEYSMYMQPEFVDHFKERSTGHVFGFGRALTDRAMHSIIKDEMRRFREPEWAPLYQMVLAHIRDGKPITAVDRANAHEEMIRLQVYGRPGVYVHQSPHRSFDIYVGAGANAVKRGVRNNGDMRLARVYATATSGVAFDFEQLLHRKIVESGLVVSVRFPDAPVGSQGTYTLDRDVDGVAYLDGIVAQHYSTLCRAVVGVDVAPTAGQVVMF